MQSATGYIPTRDQSSIAAEITAALDRLLPLSRLHASPNESDATWAVLEDLGLFGITLGENLGGSGLGSTEQALIAMALGRRLIAPAVIASMGALHAPEFHSCHREITARRVAAGYRRDRRILQVDEARSAFLLLREDDRSLLVELGDAAQPLESAIWLANLRALDAVGKTVAVFQGERLLQLRLLDAAVLVGISEAALDMAVAYAGIREQFGRPIGSFQAVQHHCANMAVAARRARDQTSFSAVAMDMRRADADLQVQCAFLTAGAAAVDNAGLNIQIHGGIGFSDEAEPHLLLKRAQLYTAIGGGLEAARARIAEIGPVL